MYYGWGRESYNSGICSNRDRSVFYFATDTVVVQPNVISGKIDTYHDTTTKSNCLEVNDSYRQNYFKVVSSIYVIDQGSIIEFTNVGYFFIINSTKNIIISSKDIANYNDKNVKLYQCDGDSCQTVEESKTITYFADANIYTFNLH